MWGWWGNFSCREGYEILFIEPDPLECLFCFCKTSLVKPCAGLSGCSPAGLQGEEDEETVCSWGVQGTSGWGHGFKEIKLVWWQYGQGNLTRSGGGEGYMWLGWYFASWKDAAGSGIRGLTFLNVWSKPKEAGGCWDMTDLLQFVE